MKKILLGVVTLMLVALHIDAAPNYRRVNLQCRNPGTHQDVAKTPKITNTSGHALSADIKVYWSASDGDNGFVMGPFQINQSKLGLGEAGNAYSCEAYYLVRLF